MEENLNELSQQITDKAKKLDEGLKNPYNFPSRSNSGSTSNNAINKIHNDEINFEKNKAKEKEEKERQEKTSKFDKEEGLLFGRYRIASDDISDPSKEVLTEGKIADGIAAMKTKVNHMLLSMDDLQTKINSKVSGAKRARKMQKLNELKHNISDLKDQIIEADRTKTMGYDEYQQLTDEYKSAKKEYHDFLFGDRGALSEY